MPGKDVLKFGVKQSEGQFWSLDIYIEGGKAGHWHVLRENSMAKCCKSTTVAHPYDELQHRFSHFARYPSLALDLARSAFQSICSSFLSFFASSTSKLSAKMSVSPIWVICGSSLNCQSSRSPRIKFWAGYQTWSPSMAKNSIKHIKLEAWWFTPVGHWVSSQAELDDWTLHELNHQKWSEHGLPFGLPYTVDV